MAGSESYITTLRDNIVSFGVDLFAAMAARPRKQRQWFAAAIDGLLCIFAAWIAFSLRIGQWELFSRPIVIFTAAALLLWYPIAWRMGVYLTIIRFSGGRTMMGLAAACSIYAIPMVIAFMVVGVPTIPRTLGLLQPLIFLSLLSMSRVVIRFALVEILHVTRSDESRRRVLIYGAGRAGQQLALSLRHEPQMHVVGFIDDDQRLDGQRLDGLPVFGSERLDKVLKARPVDEVLLAIPQASRARRRAIVDELQGKAVHVRSLPSVAHIIEGHVTINDLRDIQIEDLLGREPVAPNQLLMGKTIAGKRVLVSGAGGSIGSELCRQILFCHPEQLVLVEQSEFALYAIEQELRALAAAEGLTCQIIPELVNIAGRNSVQRVYRSRRPETVFHAAAYKHVPLVEANPISGIRNNVMGTLYSVEAAEEAGVGTFILISTDKAVRPTNIMGASKRVCELVLQAKADTTKTTVFTMVRFGNVLGSSGSVVPLFKAQIAAGGPLTITHRDVTRYFMTIPEASQLVIQAGAMARGGEVFVLDMGQPIRILDLATTMVRLSGLTVRDSDHPDGDLEVIEVGMRPGEKLYEELLIGENPQGTSHPRIMRADEAMIPWDRLNQVLTNMEARLLAGDMASAIALLKQLVPEYAPDNQVAAMLANHDEKTRPVAS